MPPDQPQPTAAKAVGEQGASLSLAEAAMKMIEVALLADLKRQHPDMQMGPMRDTIWLDGGDAPWLTGKGVIVNVRDLAEAVSEALHIISPSDQA